MSNFKKLHNTQASLYDIWTGRTPHKRGNDQEEEVTALRAPYVGPTHGQDNRYLSLSVQSFKPRADPPLRLKRFGWLKHFSVEFELTNQRALLKERKERTFPITSIYTVKN